MVLSEKLFLLAQLFPKVITQFTKVTWLINGDYGIYYLMNIPLKMEIIFSALIATEPYLPSKLSTLRQTNKIILLPFG